MSQVLRQGNVPRQIQDHLPLGPADPGLAMDRMILAFRLRPEARKRLDRLLADQQDPASPGYHQWLQPEAFARAFGPGPEEVGAAARWLEAQGFTVEAPARGGMSLLFSGDVAAVQRAFRTPIQRFFLDGRERHANALDPVIPAELAACVQGVVSLHDLPRRAANTGAHSLDGPLMNIGGNHYLAPGDFATIYNLAPLHAAGLDGTGVSVAIVGRSNPGLGDVATFRAAYGLPSGNVAVVLNGRDPGLVNSGEAVEANLDMQWSGAAAPGASIKFVCSASTNATDGVDLSAQYAVDNNLAPVMSVSFGECEAYLGTNELTFYENLWAQAAAQGITVCVSSGDSGAAGCSGGSDLLGSGRAVSGLASTPSNVCVGGTEFQEGAGTYWGTGNGADGGSALGYIPEAAWNESGDEPLGSGLWAGGGGASSVYPKPIWQAGPGVPADGHRDLPDVAFSAASHDGYLMRSGGALLSVGGTSASSPAFAGIMAMLVQKTGQRQGNANPMLYGRAAAQAPGGGSFHDVTTGDIAVPGTSGFQAGQGYDLATGLGSLDAEAFVNGAPAIQVASTSPGGPQKLGATLTLAFTATGGTPPYTFTLAAGTLPPGLALASGGTLSGTLATEGTFAFVLQAQDAQGLQGFSSGGIQVGPVTIAAGQSGAGQLVGVAATYTAAVAGAVDTSVTWSAEGGTLSPTGPVAASFQALQPGTYRLTATAAAAPGHTAGLEVVVHDADFLALHPGQPPDGLDALYLAGLVGMRQPGADLNGDGVVDNADLAVLFDTMGW